MRIKTRQRRYGMVIDTRRCVGCQNCVLACQEENGLPLNSFRDWIVFETAGAFPDLQMEIRSERCQHCTDAPCVANCPTGASYTAQGGIVAVDRDLCTGCKACIASCPYEARYIHPDGYADKCTFCLHRLEKGQLPACVEQCPTSALVFGDTNDPRSEIAKLLSERKHHQLNTDVGTKPNLWFLT